METIEPGILEQLLAASAEPIVVVNVDHTDWPVVRSNEAFAAAAPVAAQDRPFADVIEELGSRDLALDVSETVRSRDEASFPVELGGREYLLVLKPLCDPDGETIRYYAAFWRGGDGAGAVASADMQHALLKAKHRIRDLTRDDPVTGLLNSRAFRETFEHDWAVAARENSALALVVFTLDDFEAYRSVFGKHASDSCLRRVGQAVRRCLRRASDVVARFDSDQLVVLSHGSDESAVGEFAGRISTAVRELGLHHPRSTVERFVTVSYSVLVANAGDDERDADGFLNDALRDD